MFEIWKKLFEKSRNNKSSLQNASNFLPEQVTIPNDDQKALQDAIHKWVWGGFEDLDTIRESAFDYLNPTALNSADSMWINNEIDQQWSEKISKENMWSDTADFDKVSHAFDLLEHKHIIALHCAGYTTSDARDDAVQIWYGRGGKDSQTIGYCFYHGQDVERVLETGDLYVGFGCFDNGMEAFEIAKIVVAELKSQGLNIVEPVDAETRILIKGLVWRKKSPVRYCTAPPLQL